VSAVLVAPVTPLAGLAVVPVRNRSRFGNTMIERGLWRATVFTTDSRGLTTDVTHSVIDGRLESGALACGQTRGGRLAGFEVGGEVASENLVPTWLKVAAGVGEGRRDWLAELVKLDLQVQRALTAD
jgi:hypothetical protein